jgi:menaquinol-cytochrome c reductase cytochrome b subunit
MANKKKPGLLHKLLDILLYPLLWLEERTSLPGRSGLVGGVKYFLFRRVPGDISWGHTLGSAAFTAFIVQAVTGVILAMYYQPDPDSAYESIRHITDDLTLGWLVRGMHRWGASVFIILLFLHMGRVFLYGAYKYPRELNWIIGVVLVILTFVMSLTGYLLPFDQRSYWATIVAANITASGPLAGPYLGDFLRGGAEFNATTLSRFYSIHMLLVPGLIAALIGAHLYLVARLGTTAPPWLKPEEPEKLKRERV